MEEYGRSQKLLIRANRIWHNSGGN